MLYSDGLLTKDSILWRSCYVNPAVKRLERAYMRQGTIKYMGGRLISVDKTPAEIPPGLSSDQCPQAVLFVISINVYAPCVLAAIIVKHEFKPANR